jgi:hypothetical protein
MSHSQLKTLSFALLVLGTLILAGVGRSSTVALAAQATSAGPKAVEPDMHEFMEYVFEPTYKRLKLSMAAAPANNSAWKGIKGDALVLAESGNLLLHRQPKDNVSTWDELSVAVRDAGGALYQSAKKKDYATARQHYEVMLKKCNACHDKFAGGEHQLAP